MVCEEILDEKGFGWKDRRLRRLWVERRKDEGRFRLVNRNVDKWRRDERDAL